MIGNELQRQSLKSWNERDDGIAAFLIFLPASAASLLPEVLFLLGALDLGRLHF